MRKTLIDICNQLFVSTATWGLNRWEKFLDIPTDYTQAYESRRQKILRKLQGSQTVTLEFLTKLVNLYVADSQAVVIDHPDTYSIEILYHGGQIMNYAKLRDAVNIYIPDKINHFPSPSILVIVAFLRPITLYFYWLHLLSNYHNR